MKDHSASPRFTVRWLFLATTISAMYIGLWAATPPWIATIVVLLGSFILTAVALVVAINGERYHRAFAVGALPALFVIIVNMGFYVDELPVNTVMVTDFLDSDPAGNAPSDMDYPRFDLTYRQYMIMLALSFLCGVFAAMTLWLINKNPIPTADVTTKHLQTRPDD